MTMNFVSLYPQAQHCEWATQAFTGFVLDSRQVQQGQIFVALQSNAQQLSLDTVQQYIESAFAKGAIACITEIAELASDKVLYIDNLKWILGQLQRQFLQHQQAQQLARAVAVTGTNGKTTVSRLIAELLTLLQHPTAVMGTTGNGILPNLTPSTHTTLQALQLQSAHYEFSQQGAAFIALEASSHGLDQGRLAGTDIEVAIFTNLSRDHLDYHGSFEEYATAKAQLFSFPSLKYAVIHQDDEYAHLMIETAQNNPSVQQVLTFSMQESDADYTVSDLAFSLQGATFNLHYQNQRYAVHSALLGQFNVANVIAAIITVEKLGFDLEKIVALVPQLKGAAGRMQAISDGNRLFIVDYAHTPDALAQVLSSLKANVEQNLWAVFGCGGDRDRGKRPLMTQAALDNADKIILTTDNPRTENPEQIFADMKQGIDFTQYHAEQIDDRREAIKYVVKNAQQGDIVVIAGKGHENYQEIDGVRHWFDDVVEVQSALQQQSVEMPANYSA